MGYVYYHHRGVQNFKNHIRRANADWAKLSQASQIVDIVSKQNNSNVLFFVSSGTNIYTLVTNQGKYKADFMSLETAEENNIDWNKYDFIVVPEIQFITTVSNPDKYRKAVRLVRNGDEFEYIYSPDLFANCEYTDRRQLRFDWLNADNARITCAACFYKEDIFKKHGFKYLKSVENYNKEPEYTMYIYKKEK